MTSTSIAPKDEPPAAAGQSSIGLAWLWLSLPVAFISAFAELGYAVLNNSVYGVFFIHGLGLAATVMVYVMMPFFISEVVFKGPLGVLADHWGRKPLMVLGPALSIFTPLITILVPYKPHTTSVPYLCLFGALRLIDGLGAAALWPASFAYIGDVVAENKRASAMSLLNVTYIIGLALGFLVGGWADDTFGPYLTGKAGLRIWMAQVARGMAARVARWRGRHRGGIGAHHGGPAHPTGPVAGHPSGFGHHVQGFGHHISRAASHLPGILHHWRGVRPLFGPPPVTLVPQAHFYPSFYLASILFAAATIVSLLAIRGRMAQATSAQPHVDASASQAQGPDPHTAPVTWQGIVEAIRQIPDMIILTLVAFFGIGCIALLVKVFALDEFGFNETEFGKLILFPAAIIGILAVPIGHATDKFGKAKSVRMGFIMCSMAMWLLIVMTRETVRPGHVGAAIAHPHGAWFVFLSALTAKLVSHDAALILGGTLLGLGFVVAFPAWMALLTTISKTKTGTIIGAVSTAQGIGMVFGVQVGGWFYDHAARDIHLRHLAPFIVSATFLTLATVLSFTIMRRDEPVDDALPAAA